MSEIHPVLRRLLARRGLAAPGAKDGRTIVLAHFGGLMVAARGGAALTAFEEMGLTAAFDEIYTMSSGFANSSYFLAGQMRMGTAAYYKELSGLKFLNFLRPRRLADLDYLLRVVRELRPLDVQRLFASPTKLYTMVTRLPELENGIFLELHDFDPSEYFELLRACSSLLPVAKDHVVLKGEGYRDVFYDQALKDFMEHVFASGATDFVILYNYDWQRSYVREAVGAERFEQENVCEFVPPFFAGFPEWFQKFTRLDTRSGVVKRQAQRFGDEVKRALGSGEPVGLE